MTRFRFTLLASVLFILSLYKLFSHNEPYSINTRSKPVYISQTDSAQSIQSKQFSIFTSKPKASFVTVCTNKDLKSILKTILLVETRFNSKFHYDWTFIAEQGETFTTLFKESTSNLISGETHFGEIDREHWRFPEFIDGDRSLMSRRYLASKKMKNGADLQYRHRVRYLTGFIQDHPLLQDFEYIWRIEPSGEIECDLNYDVFKLMRSKSLKYGFIGSFRDVNVEGHISIWNTTLNYIDEYQNDLAQRNSFRFLKFDDDTNSYSTCSIWNSLEIIDLKFMRSVQYRNWFRYFDEVGKGIYYERWTDSNLRAIAISLLLDKDEVHFFGDFGYEYEGFEVCPMEQELRVQNGCSCDEKKSMTWNARFCIHKWFIVNELQRPERWRDHMNRELTKNVDLSVF